MEKNMSILRQVLKLNLFLLAVLILNACAYIPAESGKKIVSVSSQRVKEKNCQKVLARVGLMQQIPFEISDLERTELRDNTTLSNDGNVLKSVIRESEVFDISGMPTKKEALIFGYSIYRKTHNYGLLWFPYLTLGIIPAKVSSDYLLGVRVFNKEGKLLTEYKSQPIHFDYYVGLWFVPLAKRNDSLNLREIENKYLPALFYDVLEQMSNDGVVSCKH